MNKLIYQVISQVIYETFCVVSVCLFVFFLILFSVGYWYKCSAYIFTYTITNLYSQKQASRGVLLVLKMNSKLIKIKLWFLKNTYKISVLFKLQSSISPFAP